MRALIDTARQAAEWRTRLHALWTLDGIDAVQPALVQQALEDQSRDVRAGALRIAERWLGDAGHPIQAAAAEADRRPGLVGARASGGKRSARCRQARGSRRLRSTARAPRATTRSSSMPRSAACAAAKKCSRMAAARVQRRHATNRSRAHHDCCDDRPKRSRAGDSEVFAEVGTDSPSQSGSVRR